MPQAEYLVIVEQCLALEQRALDAYRELSLRQRDPALSEFWQQMSEEEAEHLAFWTWLKPVIQAGGFPQILDRPWEVVAELDRIVQATEGLPERMRASTSVSASFNLALLLELHVLHPAFAALFQLGAVLGQTPTPADDYAQHLARFVAAGQRYGDDPVLDLLRDTTVRLWQQNRELTLLSQVDALTGILNRRGLELAMTCLANLAQRSRAVVGVLMIDIDHFKEVNDRYGHAAGDRVLASVAAAIARLVRRSDVVGRFGGEEFLVFLPQIEPGTLPVLGRSIRAGVAHDRGIVPPVTISIGGAEAAIGASPKVSIEHLVSRADDALYAAKRAGRDCMIIAGSGRSPKVGRSASSSRVVIGAR